MLDLSDADSDLLAPTPPTVAKPASPPPSTAQPDAPPAYMLAGSLGEGVQAAGSSERLRAAAAAATDSLPDADCEEVLRLRGGSSAVQGYCEDECSDELYDEPSEVEQDEEDRHEEGGSIGSGLQGQLAPPDAVTPSTYRLLLHTSASAGAGTKAQVGGGAAGSVLCSGNPALHTMGQGQLPAHLASQGLPLPPILLHRSLWRWWMVQASAFSISRPSCLALLRPAAAASCLWSGSSWRAAALRCACGTMAPASLSPGCQRASPCSTCCQVRGPFVLRCCSLAGGGGALHGGTLPWQMCINAR